MSPPVCLLIGLGVDSLQQLLHVHTVNGAGFGYGLAAAAGAAQAVHTNGQEDRSRLGRHIQDIADDSIFRNGNHGKYLQVFIFVVLRYFSGNSIPQYFVDFNTFFDFAGERQSGWISVELLQWQKRPQAHIMKWARGL